MIYNDPFDGAHIVGQYKCSTLICSICLPILLGVRNDQIRADPYVEGGDSGSVAGLSFIDVNNPVANTERYSRWAHSVSLFPKVIKKKVRL